MARSDAISATGEGPVMRSRSRRQRQQKPLPTIATRVLSIIELAEMVIKHLSPSHKDLAAAASVNKLFHAVATPLLYETIIIGRYANCREPCADLASFGFGHPSIPEKQHQLLDLLSTDKSKAAAVRHITIPGVRDTRLSHLLLGCTSLLSLNYVRDLDDDFDEDGESSFPPWHTTNLGSILRSLSIFTHEYDFYEEWHILLGSFHSLESLELVGRIRYAHIDVEQLPLRATVKELILHDEDQMDGYRPDDLGSFIQAFTSLEHLEVSLWTDGFYLPSIYLPPSLRTFELHDDTLGGYVDILCRLSDPNWLPLLRQTPILNTSDVMIGWLPDCLDAQSPFHEVLPTPSELERLIDAACNGLSQRPHWREGGRGKASWNELLRQLRLASANETELDGPAVDESAVAVGTGGEPSVVQQESTDVGGGSD